MSIAFHEQTKHIKVDYHFIRDAVISERISPPSYIAYKDQLANVFTKVLPSHRLELVPS